MTTVEDIKDEFRSNYGYICIDQVEESEIDQFVEIADRHGMAVAVSLLSDYIISQGLADIQE